MPPSVDPTLESLMSTRSHAPEIMDFRSETTVVGGVRLHYWIGGNPNGMPVLSWHGFLGTAYSWHKVMPLLVQAGFSILVPDMRGYGDSDKPARDEGYDSLALAEEFRALIRQIEFGTESAAPADRSRYGRSTCPALGSSPPAGDGRVALHGGADDARGAS